MKTVWLFNTREERKALSAQNPEISYKSAYKALLCEVLERDLLVGQAAVTLYYPVVEGDEPLRFRLETYPLQALYPDCEIAFVAEKSALGENGGVYYRLVFADGREEKIFAPVRWKDKADGTRELAATAWQCDENGSFPQQSAFEDLYDQACELINTIPLSELSDGKTQIRFDITLTGTDEPLNIGHEHLSLAEALHEEIYFSGLEILEKRFGVGNRRLRAGQILPVVRYGAEDSFKVTISAEPSAYAEQAERSTLADEHCNKALCPQALACEVERLGGKRFDGVSVQGRALYGVLINEHLPQAFALSAGQHANESSGVVGALRAAKALCEAGDIGFSYRPLGNPDGYAAFLHLCYHAPNHMHHAARYTAAGCDLAYGDAEPLLPEYAHTQNAKALLPQAWLHLNLHGYPAHEWTRPLSGYVPRHFARWTIPKGFFIIIRYRKDYKAQAEAVLQSALAAVMSYAPQVEQNLAMVKAYLDTVGEADFPIYEGVVPYSFDEYENMDYGVELITEAPDETVSGDWFMMYQEMQYRVVMAVAKWLKEQS
ncbi:MAG: hypothetical protein Q4B71_07155 [Cardiobacteriaceae bacterium]|nr:hypothetical protein [Cardiobacteriaceae bacterium]